MSPCITPLSYKPADWLDPLTTLLLLNGDLFLFQALQLVVFQAH